MTTPFDQLHPVVQYHIVNSIGWPKLREIQESCIGPILAGENLIVLAQTAGGKTEAAFFPLMSRLLTEQWNDLSILYISPIRALLNNQESRLAYYFELIGRRAATWHGDVTASAKKRLLKSIPNCLLTTPESLEAMLCSRKLDHRALFSSLHAVVIDEVHAFAGDDRGWHLLSVLSRLSKVCGQPIQRVGLSATVGNPEELAAWLDAGSGTGGRVIKPTMVSNKAKPAVKIDYVGNLENAAKVISRLHQGEKRLVFCDSRALVEQLAATLQGLGTGRL